MLEGKSKQQTAIDEEKLKSDSKQRAGAGTGKLEGRLIVAEKRTTGSVSWGGKCNFWIWPNPPADLFVKSMARTCRLAEPISRSRSSLPSWFLCKVAKS